MADLKIQVRKNRKNGAKMAKNGCDKFKTYAKQMKRSDTLSKYWEKFVKTTFSGCASLVKGNTDFLAQEARNFGVNP